MLGFGTVAHTPVQSPLWARPSIRLHTATSLFVVGILGCCVVFRDVMIRLFRL